MPPCPAARQDRRRAWRGLPAARGAAPTPPAATESAHTHTYIHTHKHRRVRARAHTQTNRHNTRTHPRTHTHTRCRSSATCCGVAPQVVSQHKVAAGGHKQRVVADGEGHGVAAAPAGGGGRARGAAAGRAWTGERPNAAAAGLAALLGAGAPACASMCGRADGLRRKKEERKAHLARNSARWSRPKRSAAGAAAAPDAPTSSPRPAASPASVSCEFQSSSIPPCPPPSGSHSAAIDAAVGAIPRPRRQYA